MVPHGTRIAIITKQILLSDAATATAWISYVWYSVVLPATRGRVIDVNRTGCQTNAKLIITSGKIGSARRAARENNVDV